MRFRNFNSLPGDTLLLGGVLESNVKWENNSNFFQVLLVCLEIGKGYHSYFTNVYVYIELLIYK